MPCALDVDGLTVRYGSVPALREVGFRLAEGGFLTVLGPNGSGKSTLLKALLGLVPGVTGTIRLFDRPRADVPADWVAYVPQVKTLDRRFPARARDLVLTGLHRRWLARPDPADRRRADEALARVGAGRLAERSLADLSGGELQRVYLARCFAQRPRLILLDEPATGIDVVGAADLYDLLDAYQHDEGATLVMVTHDWEVAYHHATAVLLLSGQQISYGPPREALTDACVRKAFGHMGHAHGMLLTGAAHGHVHRHAPVPDASGDAEAAEEQHG